MDEELQERLDTFEKYAIAIQQAFERSNKTNQSIQEETRSITDAMAKKIQELLDNNKDTEELIRGLQENGLAGPSTIGGSVDEKQVKAIIERFIYDDQIFFARILKNHTAQIFKEVERRYQQKAPAENKKHSVWKAIALSVSFTSFFFLAVWGLYTNYKEKPYYQVYIPAGGHIYFQDKTKNQPNVITVPGGYISPLAEHKNGKYLFFNYLQNGDVAKDETGDPIVYYVYDNDILEKNVKVMKLGVP
jgi:hypothetical protein